MDEDKKPKIYTMPEEAVNTMISAADQQIDMLIELLEDNVGFDPIDMKLISLLCDGFSSNYHVRRLLQLNLSVGTITDKKTKEEIVSIDEKDLLLIENAVLAVAFTKRELLKLNYSLSLH